MGICNKVGLISVLILILSIAIHNYNPVLLMPVLQHPTVQQLSHSIHRIVKSSQAYFLEKLEFDTGPQNNEVLEDSVGLQKLFTTDELKTYDGTEGSRGLYLAILGLVFDVEKGAQYYGPDKGYGFFSGRDGSRAFVSGDFSEKGLTDDIAGLTTSDYIGLEDWVKFYKKEYKYVGKLIGRYYDAEGKPTQYNLNVQNWIADANAAKESENEEKQRFPPCNSEWYPETGSRVYCTKKSGGIARDWVGVPRKVIRPGITKPRCACVRNFGPSSDNPGKSPHSDRGDLDHPHLKEFPGCKEDAESCKVIED